MLGSDQVNNNMMCVVVDIIILIIIDIPDMPYPMNGALLSIVIIYICFKLFNGGEGAQLYHLLKTMTILLLALWYIFQRDRARFRIQKIMY